MGLGFFDDVFLPPELLQQPAQWVESSKEWCWKMEEEAEPLFYSLHGKIRLKVHGVTFASPDLDQGSGKSTSGAPCMSVVGRADSTGLGMLAWEWGE